MAKIPVRETIVEAYRYTFAHIGKIISLIWLPQLLLSAGGYFAVKPYLTLVASNPDPSELVAHGSMLLVLYTYVFLAVFLLAWLSVVVVRELLAPTADVSYMVGLRPGRFHKAAGGMFSLFGLFLLSALVFGIVAAVIGILHLGEWAAVAALVVWGLAAVYFGVRLGYLIVPVAQTEDKMGLSRSWVLTKGQFWRIIGVVLACTLPLALVSELFQTLILGPGKYLQLISAAKGTAVSVDQQLDNLRLMVDRLPLLMGLQFFLAPFQVGLTLVPVARIYQALTAPSVPAVEENTGADAGTPAV